ncbi:hypothetical protein KUCAC02_033063 [Chaenocephalus aceratus]|nr:hypothetical protein KUCAC02_033063 [Chaenocephalus aceratus]
MSSTRIHRWIRAYRDTLSERRTRTNEIPYGCYKYESGKSDLPAGLFHFVKDADLYIPTLHGLHSDYIRSLKEVAVCSTESPMANRPFLNTPHLYEVELINTGHESLKQGDRFTVQLPDRKDVAAQLQVEPDPGYHRSVNGDIWGGLLATRRVNCEAGGDPVEEAIQAIRNERGFDILQLVSPYTPMCILSMMTLVANGADHHRIEEVVRKAAAAAVNRDFDADNVSAIAEDVTVREYLNTVVRHAMNIVESVQGFAAGQVVRACSGYNISTIGTGDRFMAQLNMNRWLS